MNKNITTKFGLRVDSAMQTHLPSKFSFSLELGHLFMTILENAKIHTDYWCQKKRLK